MAAYQISITVDSNSNFSYSPSTLRVKEDDTVSWLCSTPFAIVFKERTPFEAMDIYCSGGTPTDPLTVRDAARGHYHYAVAVWDGARVHIDAGCPDIIAN